MAANTKISYQVGLNIDTKQAKQDMNELLKSISKISDQAIVSFDTKQIREGIEAARELERHLTKAFDVSTGNLDLAKFSASIKQSNGSLEALAIKLQSFGPTGQASFNQLANAINSAQVPLKRTSTMVDNLMINLKKTAQWQLSSTIIHGAQAQLSQAINYVKNLNKSLTNIAIVSDLSSKQLAEFAISAQKMGRSLATSTLDVTNAALIYFQQGDSVLQAMEKAAITIKAANASANSSAAEMSEYLTAIWNSYKVGAEDLQAYVDVMAALGAKTASSMEEIATAMQKVAATANTVGVQFDQMSSIISTVSSVTRESAESIGTSYKTILARIGDLKMGNLVEDGVSVTLGQVSGQLKNMGVNILDAKGNMRDMGSVIEEIGAKWQGMNEAQKAAVAQTIAGKRQYTQLMALFENWDMYQQNMVISEDSAGALDKMQETWATSWEAASNRVRNSMEGIYSSLIDDSVVTGFLNIIAEVISGVDSVIDKMGGLGGVITMIGGLFATKLGGRTTEIIDALKTNLGLMTGSTKKQMIELNKEMEKLSIKSQSQSTSKADQIHYGAIAKKSSARATYLKNQDRLSLEERERFNAKSQKFDELSAQRESVEKQKNKLERENSAARRKRETQFFDSSLSQSSNLEEVGAARNAASLAEQEANAARETAKQAHQAVLEAEAAHAALQAELTALTDHAIEVEKERDQKIEEAAKQRDEGGQRGLLRQAQNKENELTDLEDQIKAKRAELEQAEQKIEQAKADRSDKNTIMKQKDKSARKARAKVKEVAKNNESSKELRKIQKELVDDLKPVEVPLEKFISLQESGASSGQVAKAGKELFSSMEKSLLDSAKKANLGEQLQTMIGAKITDIEATMSMDLNEEEVQSQVTAAKQALLDLQTVATASGFEVQLNIEGVNDLATAKSEMSAMNAQIIQAATAAGASEEAIAKLMESFGIDPADIQSIRDAGNAMGELEGQSAEISGSLHQLGQDMEGAAVPTTTLLDSFTSIIGTAMTVVGAIQAVSGAFETMSDPDATGIERATAALMAMGSVVGVVTSAMQMLNVVDDAYITRQAKKLVGTQANNLEEAKSIILKERNTQGTYKGIAALMAEKVALVAHTVAQWAANAAKIVWHALSGPKGWAILAGAVAITAVATVALINHANEQKRLNEAMEESNTIMEDNANAIQTLKGDLVSLASILNNTSLSYEEQLEKINEVTSAYGVQATMLDVLSGNYGRLAAEMTNAVAAEAAIARTSMQQNLTNRTETISDQIELGSTGWFGDNAFWGDANNSFLKKWDNTKISSAEKDWLVDSNINFSKYGMTLNKNGQLESTRDLTAEDYMGLYDALTAAGVQDQNFSDDSYMGQMLAQMEGAWDLDSLDRLEQQIADAEQFERLITEFGSEFDMLNLEGRERSLEEMYSLMESMELTSQDEIANMADYLGQYEHWAPASQQLLAVEEQAAQVAAANGVDQEQVSAAMREALFPGEDGEIEIDVETLIRVNPSDIVWNDDGTFDISEEAQALAQAQVDKQKAIDKQAAVASVSKISDGKETLDRNDYESIAASGLFEEGSDEFNQFMVASPATRAMILQQKQLEAEEEELTALQAEVENATILSEQYKERYEAYLEGLAESLAGTALENEFKDEEGNNLTGEALYRAMASRKQQTQAQLDYMKNYQDTVITEDTSEADAEAYKTAALAAMSAEDAAIWRNKTAQEIYEGWSQAAEDGWDSGDLQADLDALELATAEGEALEAGISDTMARMTEGMDEIEAIEWWNNTGKAIAEATSAVEGFTNSIGQLGKMSAEDLAELQLIDPNAFNNYKTMTSDQWDAYAYEQSMAYYDNLLALYDKDSIDYAITLQEKQAAQDEYYNVLREKAKASAEYMAEQAEKEAEAIEKALSKLSGISFEKGLEDLGLDGIEQLRQSLMEVYNDAELVDAMIRNIGKEKAGSKEAALALADAKMALGMKGHEALVSQQQEAASILSYSAEVETIEPPLYNDDGVLKFKTENGEILTQIKGMPDNIFINEKGQLVELNPKTGTYTILGNAANSVFLTKDGKLKAVDPVNGTYTIIDDAANAEFFNDNGTLKVRTALGTYIVQDVNATDFFTDKGVLEGKSADGSYTITADNQTTFFDSTTGALKSDLNGQGLYTVKATSGNKEVFLEEGGVLKLASFNNGQANFIASISDKAGDGTPGSLSVTGGVISISSVSANGEITAGLKEGEYKGITANADGTITISGIDPNSPQGTAFLEVAAQEGLGINITGEGENTSITLSGFTPPTVDPIEVSAEAGAGISGTGTEADPFTPNIDTSDKYQTIRVSYIEENYDALNDKLYNWSKNAYGGAVLEGTGFTASDSRGSGRETRNSIEDIADGDLAWAFSHADAYYGGDFLKMYKENVSMRDVARSGAQELAEEVTSWYNIAYQDYLDQFNGDVEQANAAIQTEIANMGENSGIQLMFDLMEAEMSLGSGGDVMNLFDDYTDINGRHVTAEESVERMVNLWLNSFEGSLYDGTLEDSAIFLIQGLVQGLEGNTDMLAKVAQMLGYTTIEEMNRALGIASPSKYTMEMGYWLIAGLSKGFQEAEFDPGNFGESVMNRIKDQLKDVDMAEIWAEMGLGFQDMTDEEFNTAVANNTLSDRQKEQVLTNWNNANTSQQYETYDELIASGADVSTYHSGVKTGVVKSRAEVMASYGARTVQTDQGWIIEAQDATGAWKRVEGILYETESAAENAFIASEYAAQKTAEYLDGGFWDDKTLSDAQKVIMDQIIQEAVTAASDGEFTDVSKYLANGGSLQELMPHLENSYADYQTSLENAVDLSWAKIKQTWVETLTECQEYDQEAAQETYDRWVTIWQEIGKARIAAIQGEEGVSVSDSMTEEGRRAMIERILKEQYGWDGKGPLTQEMVDTVTSIMQGDVSQIDAKYLSMGAFGDSGINEVGLAKYLPTDAYGYVIGGTEENPYDWQTFRDNVRTGRMAETTANFEDSFFGANWMRSEELGGNAYIAAAGSLYDNNGQVVSMEDFFALDSIQALGIAEDKQGEFYGTLMSLIESGVIAKDGNGNYGTSYDMNDILEYVAYNGLPDVDDATGWAELFSDTVIAHMTSEQGYVSDYKTQKKSEYDAELAEIEDMQALVHQAMENGWESLKPEERDILEEYMANQGWETLGEANTGLARKADQVTAALNGMLDALKRGFVPDGNGGYVDPSAVIRSDSQGTIEGTVDGLTAEQRAAEINRGGYTLSADGSTYTRQTAIDNGDGTYTLVTDSVSADSYISPEEIDDGFNDHYYEQEAQEYNQDLWMNQSNTSFGALETVQTESQSGPVSIQSLNALEETLDMTNPHIAQMYENFRQAALAGEDLTGVSGDLTTAILQGDGAMLENNDETRRMLENWAEMYGIVDENGKALSVDAVNEMRGYTKQMQKTRKEVEKIDKTWKKTNKTLKVGNKEYTEFSDLCGDVAKNAKKAGKSIDDYVDELEGLTDAEKELAKQAGKEFKETFDNLRTSMGDAFSQLPIDMQNAIANYDTEGLVNSLLPEGVFNQLLANIGWGETEVLNAINGMAMDSDAAIRAMGQQLQAAADENGNIDLGTVLQNMGVDVSDPIAVLEALRSFLQQLAGTPYFEGASAALGPVISALSAAQNLQATYGNGSPVRGGGGGASNPPKAQNTMPDNSGGGGGGGGSDDIQQKDKKEYDDEIERYHEIQEEMKRTSEKLDQIEKHKERAYGKKYLNLMDQEIEKLKENIEEQQRYQDEIAGYLAQDRQAAAALGAQFDAEGNITNYTQVMQSIIDDYNAAVEQYNSGNMTDEEFEDIEEQYEDAIEALEQYEETLELSAEAQAEFLELQNQLSEANLEKITYKMEIVTELNDADLEILQYYQDTYEDNLDKQDDLMRNLTQQAQEYESNILVLNDAMAELQAKFAAGEINEADFAEGMQELRDQAIGYAGDLEDLKDQFVEVYENALSLAAEEVQNFTEKMQDSADMMDTYISLTQLMGRGTNYRELEKFYETQYKANLANLETQRAYVDSLEEQAAYFEEQMKKNGELTATEQEQYEALQDALREANSELASTTEAALSSLQAAYENSINAIFKELDASIAGTAGSLADLADQYAYYQEEQSRYVSTAKELYEVSKLNRSIEQSLEDATTDASKAKLKALQEEINYISEKNDLTEYDIEMMNLQYQLTLAQIALEEAQASKDTVRLTRDQDGNMAYQYTANQEKVSQAQQQYEDVLQQINDLAANRVSELEQQCLDAEQQYLQSAQEILLDTTLTDEQRTKKLEELSQRYSETLLFIQGQYNNASQALTQNQQAVAEHYGQALVNSMGEASLQMNTVIGDMIGNAQSHIDAFNQAIEEGSMGAWSDYMAGVSALTNASGLTYDNLIANADDYAEVAENANQAAQDLIDTFTDSFEDINAATEQWDAHLATLEGVQQMYENIATSAQNTLEVLSGFTAGEGVGDTQAAIAALLGLSTPESVQAQVEPIVEEVLQDWIGDENNLIIEEYQEQIKRMKELYEQAPNGFVGVGGGGGRQSIELTDHEWMEIKEVFATELSSFYAAQQGWGVAAGTVQGGGGSGRFDQTVHITADFPNATDQNEIRLAFEELVNLASQHVYSSAAAQKNR